MILIDQQGKALKASNPAYEHLSMLPQPKMKEKMFPGFERRFRISFDYDDIETWDDARNGILDNLQDPIGAAIEGSEPFDCHEKKEIDGLH